MVNRISATIIADSKDEFGNRITTYVLVFPRIVLAEFNTHRAISKNSASSRAIPFKTMLKRVTEEPFIPIRFQKDHSGMQGNEYFEGEELKEAQMKWAANAQCAAANAQGLSAFNVTKQLCNRLLEPFLYHTVICTGTEWENFFALRAHPAAEIHIADLAEKMLVAYNEGIPKQLQAGEWHIPFSDIFDEDRILAEIENNTLDCASTEDIQFIRVKVATARCARVSYLNFEGKDDYGNDIRLFDTLLSSGHMSPFEHCARAMSKSERALRVSGVGIVDTWSKNNEVFYPVEAHGWSGNFKGFIQLRKTLANENQIDPRVIKQ